MEDNLELPTSAVMRLIKGALPEGVVVSKDAKLAFCRAARVFVQYLTSCSNDYSKGLGRATISGNHVLGALDELDFKDFAERLTKALEEHKAQQAEKKSKKDNKKDDEEEEDDDDQQRDDDLEVEA